ncbi:MAG: membrane protein insertase YidC [Gemmatimonadaceae bacterium]
MDTKRLTLAVVLSALFIFAMQFLLPGAKKGANGVTPADSAAVAARNGTQPNAAANTVSTGGANAAAAAGNPGVNGDTTTSTISAGAAPATPVIAAETTVVVTRRDSGATFRLSNVGATPIGVTMNAYANRVSGGKVDLGYGNKPILKYQLVPSAQAAPIDLSGTTFQSSRVGNVVTYQVPVAGSNVTIRYAIVPDSFVAHVAGTVSGGANGSYLLVNLPTTFAATEPDTADDRGYLAYAYMSKRDAARNVAFKSLDPGEKQLLEGPLTWLAAKSKYFTVGVLAPKNGPGFTEATLVGGNRTTKIATNAAATVVVPVKSGSFSFDVYAGPQQWTRLTSLGRNFDEVNPYGWAFLRGVMQPIAGFVIRTVLWMHSRLKLSYGMVLIALGLLVRLLMWPLYQSSMRTSLKMQVLQPELQEVQDRYKDDPEKQRTEVMKVYQSHGMNPLSPLLGCLPSLLPMPILLALFFVFKNTIEFRGVPFFWLSDLSAKDPYYILPILMGISMYLVSWIGMRGAPPNPQTKLMGYAMPVMFTFFFWRAASGLNIYYATQNLATLPQQWQLAHERKKTGKPVVANASTSAPMVKGTPVKGTQKGIQAKVKK